MNKIKSAVKNILYTLNKNPLSKNLYRLEVNRRAQLPLTELEGLSRHINMFTPYTNEIQQVNDWYGHAKILKRFLGIPDSYKFKFVIEHGLYLSEQVADIELNSNLPTFITYSQYRVKILKKLKREAFAIGPFIHYAPHYLSKTELTLEKKRLGKTLLFFPSHSIVGSTTNYNMKWSYEKIRSISKGFNTIRVCLYWKDILLGTHKYYQSKGFECVTAGHILDPLFLPRVKSIIETADLTVSNDASTALSYCFYMHKPHVIFYQRAITNKQGYFNKVMKDYWKSEPYKLILREFSQIQSRITSKQRQLMNQYCGTNNVRSKEELSKIVAETEKIYSNYIKNGKTI